MTFVIQACIFIVEDERQECCHAVQFKGIFEILLPKNYYKYSFI